MRHAEVNVKAKTGTRDSVSSLEIRSSLTMPLRFARLAWRFVKVRQEIQCPTAIARTIRAHNFHRGSRLPEHSRDHVGF
jgi:hypothetical protein